MMNPTPDDIEKLLQQYGADQRQQQLAAHRVRGMARRQTLRLVALACTFAVVVSIGLVHYLRPSQPQTDMMAGLPIPVVENPPIATLPPIADSSSVATECPTATNAPVMTYSPTATEKLAAGALPIREALPSTTATTQEAPTSDMLPTPVETSPAMTVPQKEAIVSIEPVDPVEPMAPIAHSSSTRSAPASRFHLAMAVGATALSTTLTAASPNSAYPGNAQPYITVTSSNAVQTSIGVDYTIAQNSRHHLDVGVGLNGYIQQNNVHLQEMDYMPSFATNAWMDASDNFPVANVTNERINTQTLGLFISLPLTLHLHPQGPEKTGWQLSLAPARSLVSPYDLAETPLHGIHLSSNPWKLTLGLGLAMPHGVLRHVSLTANLLPSFTTQPLHEFGLLLGF